MPSAHALPTFFTGQCTLCHVDDTPTCSGCHIHVANGLATQTDALQYRPGDTVRVTLSTPWSFPGWIRAVLYDEAMVEIARVSGPTGSGDDGVADPTLYLPVVLTAPAPLTPGFYTWTVGWFGSPGAPGREFPHTETLVATNEFEVSETAPTTTTTTTGPTTSTTSTTTTTAPPTTTTTAPSTTTTTAPTTTTTSPTSTSTTAPTTTTPTTTTTTTTTQPRPSVPGGGSKRTDCIAEFAGVDLNYPAPPRTPRWTRCTDGDACDADCRFDDKCTFFINVCLNNTDPDFPLCVPSDVASVDVKQRIFHPDPEFDVLQAAIDAIGLPTQQNLCSAPVEITVPVKIRSTRKTPGKKKVRVKAMPSAGRRDWDRLKLWCDPGNPVQTGPPQVQVSAAPAGGPAPLTVIFSAVVTDPDGGAPCVAWDFGDGGIGAGNEVAHTYHGAGSYQATATATDPHGATGTDGLTIDVSAPVTTTTVTSTSTTTGSTATSTTAIGSTTTTTTSSTTTTTTGTGNLPPTITVTASAVAGQIALTVDFSATAGDPDGEVVSIEWSFGDGTGGSGTPVSHTYRAAGGFTVLATATDNDGGTATATLSITALPLPGPVVEQGYPTRLAEGPQGNIYVTDAELNSVLVYDSALTPVTEIGDLDRPLGVAVDGVGRVYVGNDGRDNVEVYDAGGVKLFAIDDGGIQMPNHIALDADTNVYVVDSLSDTVRVYSSSGTPIRTIGAPGAGDAGLGFPVAAAIVYANGGAGPAEIYVADQRDARVQVFDLTGGFLRAFGGPIVAFSLDSQGLFARLQSLAVDGLGALHALDSYASGIQILDPATGEYLASYGGYGAGAGKLNLPLDVLVTQSDQALIADAENHRIQAFILRVP